jgi:hypothetical protein
MNGLRRFPSLLLCLAVLQACDATLLRPRPAASVHAAASARPKASAAPVASSTPKGPVFELKGQLKIDASYVIANKVGNVIANNGANLLVVGSGLISDNGLGLISDNGLGYRVLGQAVAFGALLPVRGMEVVAVSLLDGKPLGEKVLTDSEGRYKVSVPQTVVGNTLLQARVPNNMDTRLQYDLVTKVDANRQDTLDEDSAVVTRFLRMCYVRQIESLMINGDQALSPTGEFGFVTRNNPIMTAVLQDLLAECKKVGTETMAAADRHALASRVSDVLLYHVDVEAAKTSTEAASHWTGAAEPAVAAMRDIVGQFREAATKKMTEDAKFFDQAFWLIESNQKAAAAGRPPYVIKKPADLGDYVVSEILFSGESRVEPMTTMATSLGVPVEQVYRFDAASRGLMYHIGLTLITSAEAKQAMYDTIRRKGQP